MAALLHTHMQPASAVLGLSEENDRNAYNAAFCELELGWRWDCRTYLDLLGIPEEKARIGAYIQRHHSHLLRAYTLGFLSDLIYETKCRLRQEM